MRGASNAVFGLDEETAKGRGHPFLGQPRALALLRGGTAGHSCNVVMPTTAPQAKKDAVRGYGGVITECEPSTSSRERPSPRSRRRRGRTSSTPTTIPGDRGTGDLLAGAHRAGRGTRCRDRADRRRRHDLDLLLPRMSGAGPRSMPPSPSRPTTPTAAQGRPHHRRPRRTRSRTGSRCRESPGISSRPTSPTS